MEPSSNEQLLQRKSLDLNNLVSKLLTFNYKAKFRQSFTNFQSDIGRFFDELIWAQKYHPVLVRQLFSMQILQQFNSLYGREECLLRNYIILFTNLKEKGVLTELILDDKLTTQILKLFVEFSVDGNQEAIEYLGSFLKMYQRMFCKEWIHRFIDDQGYFELLEISFKFYNCKELITRTSVLNIVFTLLGYEEVREYLRTNKTRIDFYKYIINELTKQFKQQLAQYSLRLSHTSKQDDIDIIFNELEDKIAFWEDISQSVEGCENMFHQALMRNILLPLLVGPFHYSSQPIFTLKFSLYVIKKLIHVIYQFGLIEPLIKILFIDEKVIFWPSSLQKGIMTPFKLQSLLNQQLPHQSTSLKQIYQQELEDAQQLGNKVKQFYLNIFKSKDNHFIVMSAALLSSIIEVLRKNKQQGILEACHLDQHGKLIYMFSQILLSHLSEPHHINTIITIIDTLIYLTQKTLDENLQYQYIEELKNSIAECKETTLKLAPYLQQIIQTLQYDIKLINSLKFGSISNEKFQQDYKIVFMWDPEKEQELENTFYTSIPDTFEENVRYSFVKFIILRRGCLDLIPGVELEKISNEYYSRFHSKSQYILGDIYKLHQIKQAWQCQLIDGKEKLPIIIIKDENFLVVSYFDKPKKEVKIMATLKYRHIELEKYKKKDKQYIKVNVKDFNYDTQRMICKNPIIIRNNQNGLKHIPTLQQLSKQRQITFLKNVLESTKKGLPSISLI